MHRRLVFTGLILALGALGVAAAFGRLPVGQWVVGLVGFVRGTGAVGVVAFAAAYVLATVFMLPGSVLTLGAGFVYGPLVGTLLVSPVSVLAASTAFVLGRSLARGWIGRRMEGSARLAAVDRAIGSEGFKIVLLLRLSPVVPFLLLNYSLGLTGVRLRHFVLGSWLGMLPGTALYVYLGSLVPSVAALLSGEAGPESAATRVLYWAGLVATVAATVLVARTARRALVQSLEAPAAPRVSIRETESPVS